MEEERHDSSGFCSEVLVIGLSQISEYFLRIPGSFRDIYSRKIIRYLENLRIFGNIISSFLLSPLFSSLFSWSNTSSTPETIQFTDFPLEIIHSTSQEVPKQQWRMSVTSTCLDLLPQLLILQGKFETFGLSDTRSLYFYGKGKRYLKDFSRYFENFLWY